MAPKFCGQCGERVIGAPKFCERCGNRLGAPPSPEIPQTRLGMKTPALPTIPMPSPSLGPTPAPWNVAQAPSAAPRRRRWPWIVLALFTLFVASVAGGWFAAPVLTHGLVARFGLPTGAGNAEVAARPTAALEDAPELDIRLASLSSAPPTTPSRRPSTTSSRAATCVAPSRSRCRSSTRPTRARSSWGTSTTGRGSRSRPRSSTDARSP